MSWFDEVDFVVEKDTVLSRGDSGPEVVELQRLLKAQGYAVGSDGDYGPNMVRQVRQFQRDHDLVADGAAGPKTLTVLKRIPPNKRFLSQKDLEEIAQRYNFPLASVMAIVEVESRGRGFLDDNERAVILFERHIFYRRLKAYPHIRRHQLVDQFPNIVNTVTGGYQGGADEYGRLEKAQAIQSRAAPESASWGLGQVMGFHWSRLSYNSIDDFVRLMQRSERDQLNAVMAFIAADDVLVTAVRTEDDRTFALRYNGPKGVERGYHTKITQARRRHRDALAEDRAL